MLSLILPQTLGNECIGFQSDLIQCESPEMIRASNNCIQRQNYKNVVTTWRMIQISGKYSIVHASE